MALKIRSNAEDMPDGEGEQFYFVRLRRFARNDNQKYFASSAAAECDYRNFGSGVGLLSNICSMWSRTSAVNLGTTSKAVMFSETCSGLEAPVITVLT